jgi:hypothetical protein
VVGSQIASLTPGLSFNHNLNCRCPNGPCKAIFDIYTSRPFQRYKEHLKARCFDLCNRTLTLRESRRTPSSHFWECKSHPHTCPQSGVATWTIINLLILVRSSYEMHFFHNEMVSFEIMALCTRYHRSFIVYHKVNGILTMKKHVEQDHFVLFKKYVKEVCVHSQKSFWLRTIY